MIIFEDYGLRVFWQDNGWKVYFGGIKVTNDIKMPQIIKIIARRVRVDFGGQA